MKRYIKSSRYTDYNPADGWTDEMVELHKSIDWASRDYEEYEVDADDLSDGYYSLIDNVVLYGYGDRPVKRQAEFGLYMRANPIYPPYWRPIDKKPFYDIDVAYVGPMADGDTYKGLDVHNRFETYELYDRLSM